MQTVETSPRRIARGRHSRRPWGWKLALVAGGVVLLGAAGVLAAPTISRLQIQVSDGSHMSLDGSTSTWAVPKGWFIHPSEAGVVRVDSPDRVLSIRLTVASAPPDEALESAVSDLEKDLGASGTGSVQRELLASGTALLHSDVGERGLAAVVGDEPAVTLSATVSPDRSVAAYRRVVAEILESVRP